MANVKRVFMVDGKPFYPVGGQSDCDSAYNASESETAFEVTKLLHGNTLEIPIYWAQIEPTEGKFDFASVDALLASARRHGVKLILLWFATWKNANMDYAPAWVKSNPQRFKRVMSPPGKNLWVLSSHCQANLEADKKAFTAFCKYLKAKDSTEHTVICVQVENEPGILGSDRDYGPEAQVEFNSSVPTKLIAAIKADGNNQVNDIRRQAGGNKSGTWSELFGEDASELFTAWSIASYIDSVAEAGKAAYDIPMYINVWPMNHPSWSLPGESYPSGGAVSKVLDIYKWYTPHVDMVAPDIYIPYASGFNAMCATYSRKDNPLFIAESIWEPSMFHAIADYNAIGYFFFGIEAILGKDGSIRPECQSIVDTFRCVAATIPLLLKYQGTGKVHAVVQEEFMEQQWLDFDGYLGRIQFGGWVDMIGSDVTNPTHHIRQDRHHDTGYRITREQPTDPKNRGCGLVIQASSNEFYLVGVNYRLFLRPKSLPDKTAPTSFYNEIVSARHISVDEGHFDQSGKFVVDRQRSMEALNWGAWVEADTGVVRVITCD